MEYRVLGTTGVQVSRLCFGTMSFGGDADEATSAAMYDRCRDRGINFFDCANGYAGGRSEEILGRLVAGHRDDVVLTTKAYFPTGPDVNARGASRRHLMQAVEASLKRLNTDRIDVYFLHRFDDQTPMEESLRALDDLVRQGKILYPAVSNWAAWQAAKALGMAACHDWARIQCIQPMYSLAKRQAEVEIFPLALSEQVGVITYSPLAGGLLSGKYSTTQRPATGRLQENPVYVARYGDAGFYELAERFTAYAAGHGVQPAALAVAWVMAHPEVTAPIIGARNLEQLNGSLAALEINMTPEWRAEISALSPEPPPATDRNEERQGVRYLGAQAK
jgi:aryl-alcohol dehydrogenase-like predicted oxidoreductase